MKRRSSASYRLRAPKSSYRRSPTRRRTTYLSKRRPVKLRSKRYKRPVRRRIKRYPWRYRYLWYRWPYRRTNIYVTRPSLNSDVILSSDGRLSAGARAALRRKGLYTSAWRRRLSGAGRALRDFINRFYRTKGFELVVRAYFAGEAQRRVARLTMRAAKRFRNRTGDIEFTRSSALDSRGRKLRTICIFEKVRKVHHKLLPWSRFAAEPMTRLVERDQAEFFNSPERTRYLFDKGRVTTSADEITRQVRRTYRERAPVRRERGERWLESLSETVRKV